MSSGKRPHWFRGQVAIEYIMVLGAVMAIVAVTTVLLINTQQTQQKVISNQTDQFKNAINQLNTPSVAGKKPVVPIASVTLFPTASSTPITGSSCQSLNGQCLAVGTACVTGVISAGACQAGFFCCSNAPSTGPTSSPIISVSPIPTASSSPAVSPSSSPIPTATPSPSPTPLPTPAPGFDRLTFTTGQQPFPTSQTDSQTFGSFVKIKSALATAFKFGSAQVSEFYYVTSSVQHGSATQGMIFFQTATPGVYSAYVDPAATQSSSQVLLNFALYQFAPTSSATIRFAADGIDTGTPDSVNYVIFVPETTALGTQAFQIDVGNGDGTVPVLASSTGGVAYG